MNDYLTTDDLVLYINKTEHITVKEKNKFNLNKKHIFGSIVIIAVLHLVFIALPMILGNNTKDILGYQYEIVIEKNQDLDGEILGQVLKIEPILFENLNSGDHVLIYGLYGNNYYWEVEVVEINQVEQTLSVTFDDVIRNTYHIDDIEGQIAGSSNMISTFYYTASTIRGFISMILLHAIIVYGTYYLMFQRNKKKIDEGDQHEK
ncbi:MAG: hypothetical protein WC219_06265 [Acholeplasmataceae bacterium]